MDRACELDILDRVMAHRAAPNTTDMAPEMYANPVGTYIDPDRYAIEVDQLFRGSPLVACLSADVAQPGDHVTMSITDVPVLVSRDEDGVVRAFKNVCRHRGVCVVEGRGQGASTFMCPYHGWSYRLDGRLVNPTHKSGFEGMDRSEFGLAEMACDERAGMVLIQIDGAPGTLDGAAWLGDIGAELAQFDFGRFHHFKTSTSTRAINWKLMADTFCEQYHVRYLHHETLTTTIQSDNSLYDAYGRHGRMCTPAWSIDKLDAEQRDEWRLFPHVILNYMLVPNTVLLVQEAFIEMFQFLPDGPGQTRSVATLYTADPLVPEQAPRLDKSFDGLLAIIDDEDYTMCEQTQRSFHSGAQREILFGRNEPGLIHFHQSIERMLGTP